MLNSLQKRIEEREKELQSLRRRLSGSIEVIQQNCKHNEIKVEKNIPFCTYCGYNKIDPET